MENLQWRPYALRLTLITLGVIILAASLWSGLVRIGWDFSPIRSGLPGIHGPLVVCGFLGTLFSLERAITLNKTPAYLTPLLIALGGLALIIQPEGKAGPALIMAGSAGFLLVCGALFIKQPTYHSTFMFLGSFQWLVANIIWLLAWPIYTVVLWWIGFVLFTTAGERIELMRMGHLELKEWVGICLGLFLVFAGHLFVAIYHRRFPESLDLRLEAIIDLRVRAGMVFAGIGLILSAVWFIENDLIRRSLGKTGLAGYISFCMMSAYFWLIVNGIFCIWFADLVSGFVYDAFTHTFFIGFVFFSILGHGPVIVPAFLNQYLTMKKIFYLPPVLLHFSLILRIYADIVRSYPLRNWGGLLNLAAIVLFVVLLACGLFLENGFKSKERQEGAGQPAV